MSRRVVVVALLIGCLGYAIWHSMTTSQSSSTGPASSPTAATGAPLPTSAPLQSAPQPAMSSAVGPSRPADAASAAVAFMRALARPAPTVTSSTWWENVRSRMSPAAASDYEGIDPARVPFTKVTGPALPMPGQGPVDLDTVVVVPTDAGPWQVALEREEDGRWLVVRAEARSSS